jgi:hypothetical protein
MNQPEIDVAVADFQLPDTQHELESLLEALNALNASLDQYLDAEVAPVSD